MSNAGETVYDLSGALGIDALSSVPAGSSILVSGPALSGRDDVLLDVLADGIRDGEGAVAVTTADDAADWIETLRETAPAAPGYRIAAVDCRSDGDRSGRELDGGAFAYSVSSPSNFTGIGIGITNCFDRLQDAGITEARVGLTSLSTMLTYTDRQRTFKFCHVVTSRLAAAGFLGVFGIDSDAHDDRAIQVIKQAFDGQIEVRNDDGREARFRGLDAGTTEWTQL